jgi:hypothetical protein
LKYLSLWAFDGDDIEEVLKRNKELVLDREKNPDKYPKEVYPPHADIEDWGGFTVIEGTHEQLLNLRQFWGTLMDFEFMIVIEASKAAELQRKALE